MLNYVGEINCTIVIHVSIIIKQYQDSNTKKFALEHMKRESKRCFLSQLESKVSNHKGAISFVGNQISSIIQPVISFLHALTLERSCLFKKCQVQ